MISQLGGFYILLIMSSLSGMCCIAIFVVLYLMSQGAN